MTTNYDAIVVGAGPSGSSAAYVLGEAGFEVLLIDKEQFPRDKTCGDGLTYKCREPMKRLGIWDQFLERVQFRADGYTLVLTDLVEMIFRSPGENPLASVYILPRSRLDQLLLDNALSHSKVSFVGNRRIRHLLTDEDQKVVGVREAGAEGNEGDAYYGSIVIDATGVNSPLAVEAGLGNRDSQKCAVAIRGYFENVRELNNTIEIYFDEAIQPGYFWIFPTSTTTANVGCGTFQHILQSTKTDLHDVMDAFCNTHPIASRKLGKASLCGRMRGGRIPLAIDHNASRVRDGLILLGDAGAFVNPITGEGISYALNSGILAGTTAVAALRANDVSHANLASFDDAWQTKFLRQFQMANLVTEGIPGDRFQDFLLQDVVGQGLSKSQRLELAAEKPGLQYEFLMALKSVVKFLQ